MEDLKAEITELRKEIAELKNILIDVQKTVKVDLAHTQGLYGKIDEIKSKR